MKKLGIIFLLIALWLTTICHGAPNKKCDRLCTFDYRPVCAKNQLTNELVTFGNLCAFEQDQCSHPNKWILMDTDGRCDKTEIVKLKFPTYPFVNCNRSCDIIPTQPVCALSPQDKFEKFRSPCEFNIRFCNDGFDTRWKVMRDVTDCDEEESDTK